ncbi:DgyrCDS8762 [Dimorphilus gyrociliatus]|uniref:DgyrCDS8762 n=1 Tax=Dimorphilus gyrociliatus TaxID=2664684 RepID=A0A7I8VW62_9ANNE|nr:DgyrCDS8762 [Dimorphilus gyrociliatus]
MRNLPFNFLLLVSVIYWQRCEGYSLDSYNTFYSFMNSTKTFSRDFSWDSLITTSKSRYAKTSAYDKLYFMNVNIGVHSNTEGMINVHLHSSELMEGEKIRRRRHSLFFNSVGQNGISVVNWAKLIRDVDLDHFFLTAEERIDGELTQVYSDSLSKLTNMILFRYLTRQYLFGTMIESKSYPDRVVLAIDEVCGIGYDNEMIRISESGTYLITLTSCTLKGDSLILLVRTSAGNSYYLKRTRPTKGIETVTRSFIITVRERDYLTIDILSGSLSSQCNRNSFSIFQLRDTHHISAASTLRTGIQNTTQLIGFNVKSSGQGIHANFSTNTYHIRSDGLYYIYISIGQQANYNVDVSVLVNDKTVFEILRYYSFDTGIDVISGSALLNLRYNDVIKVVSHKNADFDSTSGMTNLIAFKLN